MNLAALRPLLRAALIPLGAALVTRGLQDLRDEADRLTAAVELRRAQLAGAAPLDEDEDQAEQPAPQLEVRPRTRQGWRRPAAAGLLGLVLGVAAGRQLAAVAVRAQLAEQLAAEDAGWFAAAAFRGDVDPATGAIDNATSDAFRQAAEQPARPCKCGAPLTADGLCTKRLRDEASDEDQAADDFPHRNTAAVGSAADPCVCPDCGWIAPAGDPMTRRTSLALHRNGHASGLPGR